MKEEEFRQGLIESLRIAHYMDEAFLHGEEYVKEHSIWIEWDFQRKLKRMTEADWKRHAKAYIEALKEATKNE